MRRSLSLEQVLLFTFSSPHCWVSSQAATSPGLPTSCGASEAWCVAYAMVCEDVGDSGVYFGEGGSDGLRRERDRLACFGGDYLCFQTRARGLVGLRQSGRGP